MVTLQLYKLFMWFSLICASLMRHSFILLKHKLDMVYLFHVLRKIEKNYKAESLEKLVLCMSIQSSVDSS